MTETSSHFVVTLKTTPFDDFFRAYYKRICRYCASFGFNFNDIEEVVADVIFDRYYEYFNKCSERYTKDIDKNISMWIGRRVMLDLKSRYAKQSRYRLEVACDDETPSGVDLDSPEAILCLKQRVPELPAILIDYQQFQSDPDAPRGGAGGHGQKRIDRFKYERKKFLRKLKDGPKCEAVHV